MVVICSDDKSTGFVLHDDVTAAAQVSPIWVRKLLTLIDINCGHFIGQTAVTTAVAAARALIATARCPTELDFPVQKIKHLQTTSVCNAYCM